MTSSIELRDSLIHRLEGRTLFDFFKDHTDRFGMKLYKQEFSVPARKLRTPQESAIGTFLANFRQELLDYHRGKKNIRKRVLHAHVQLP